MRSSFSRCSAAVVWRAFPYLDWRYGTSGGLVPNTATPSGPPPPPDLVITGIVTGKSGLDLNEQTVTIVNQGSTPVVMSGWRLVSPKNDHADVYYFPQGFVLDGGAKVVVHAGQGFDGGGSLFMRRVTWLFDADELADLEMTQDTQQRSTPNDSHHKG